MTKRQGNSSKVNSQSTIISPLTAFGDLRTSELSPIFQYSFEYTVDNTELTKNVLVNGGTVTQDTAMAIISSSTTTESIACIQSHRQAKYKAGLGGLARFTTLFETGGVVDTEQYAGLSDEGGSSAAFKNGYMIGFDGGIFGFHRFQNDVKFSVPQSEWNDPLDGTGTSGMILDTSKLNVWELRFQYLGGGAITLCVEDDSTGRLEVVHTILYANKNIIPSVYMPNFRIMLYTANKTTTTDLVLKTSSFGFFVEGKSEPILNHQIQNSTGIKSKTTVTTEVAIFTIRNKATYVSKTNFIEILAEHITTSIEASSANNLGELRIIKNTTLGGTPSYSDINTTNSVVEIDTAGTTVTGGVTLFPIPLAGKNDSKSENVIPLNIILEAGETLTVSGQSANSATIKASLLWKELL